MSVFDNSGVFGVDGTGTSGIGDPNTSPGKQNNGHSAIDWSKVRPQGVQHMQGSLFTGAGMPWGAKGGAPKAGAGNNATINGPAAPSQVAPPVNTTSMPVVGNTKYAQTPGMVGAQIAPTGAAGTYSNGGSAAQAGLMAQLAGQANGTAPSVAGTQLQQGQQANLAQTMAALASSRGQPNALNQRSALNANAASNANTNNQAALLRLNEQQGAQQQLAGVSGTAIGQGLTARQQDIGVNTNNANLAEDTGKTNYQGNLQTNLAQGNSDTQTGIANGQLHQGYNQQQLGYAGLGVDAEKANQDAGIRTSAQGIQAQEANANIQEKNVARTSEAQMAAAKGAGGILGGLASKIPFGSSAPRTDATTTPGDSMDTTVGQGGTVGGSDVLGTSGGAAADGSSSAVGDGLGAAASTASKGGFVPEQPKEGGYVAGKSSFAGNNIKNDKVPTWLSPGEAVVPRSVMHAPDPVAAFKSFLQTVHTKPIGKSIAGNDDALHAVIQTAARARGGR